MESFQKLLDESRVVAAITDAELKATAEVRVHVEKRCSLDVMDRAAEVFAKLHMHQTRYRNGTLIYIAYEDHKFAILGDAGINAKVKEDFWQNELDILAEYFKKAAFTEGICKTIETIGIELQKYFPYESGDTNELSNDISYGDQ